MNDIAYSELQQRIKNGKAWIEKIKQDGTYGASDTAPYIKLWCDLVDLSLREGQNRNGQNSQDHQGEFWFQNGWHSQAWIDMKNRESSQDDKRAKERTRRAELKEQKRSGFSSSEKRT